MEKKKTFPRYAFFALPYFLLFCAFFPFSRAQALTISPIRFEISADPGQIIEEEFLLINEQKEEKTFYSSTANFTAEGETGSPKFTTSGEDLAGWIKVPESQVTIRPGETKKIAFRIEIPENAEPGGHFSAIFWNNTPPNPEGGGQVSIGARLGILVLLSINGEVNREGGLVEFSTKDNQKFFTARPIVFEYRFQNDGNDRIKPDGSVVIKNTVRIKSATLPGNPQEGNILPDSVRRFETAWKAKNPDLGLSREGENFFSGYWRNVKNEWQNFAFGIYTAKLDLVYGPAGENEAHAKTTFFVLPWHLLLLLILFIALIIFIGHEELLAYNKHIRRQFEEQYNRVNNSQPVRAVKKTVRRITTRPNSGSHVTDLKHKSGE